MNVSNLISQIPVKSASDAVNLAQNLAIEKGKQVIAGQQQVLLDEIDRLERKLNNITKEYNQKFDKLEKQVENKELTREKYDELIKKERKKYKINLRQVFDKNRRNITYKCFKEILDKFRADYEKFLKTKEGKDYFNNK